MRAVALVVAIALVASCGDDESGGASVAAQGDASGITFSGFADETVAVGDSSFLLVGPNAGGGAVAVHLTVGSDGLHASEIERLGSSQRLEESDISALELPDGSWLVTALGCPSAESCDDIKLFAYRFVVGKGAQEVGAFGGLGLESLHPVGALPDGRVLLAGGTSGIEGGGQHRGDEVGIVDVGTYQGRFVVLDLERQTVADFEWTPPVLSFNPMITDSGQVMPDRAQCLAGGTLYVLDSQPAADNGLRATLTAVPVDEASPKPTEVSLPEGDLASNLLCGGDSPLTIVAFNRTMQSVASYRVDDAGVLGDRQAPIADGAALDSSYGTTSVLVRFGTVLDAAAVEQAIESGTELEDGPPNTTTGLRAWVAGEWREVAYSPPNAALLRMTDDGSALLVRVGSEYSGVEL